MRAWIPTLAGIATSVLLVLSLLAQDAPRKQTDVGDKELVAALDTQYQAAVKVNDAATMDHILADDFMLVTGSGKLQQT